MAPYSDDDPYLDEASGVLKNRLGIADQEELDRAEATLVSLRSYQLQQASPEGDFDLKHLQAIHKHLFSDLYEWAGKLRIIDISKGGNLFAHYGHIESAASLVFRQLANEKWLAGLDAKAFSGRAAYYMGELNALHPFREGNGRTQREFISQLAHKNGYAIAWELAEEAEVFQASILSFHGDTTMLAGLIERNLHGFE